MESSGRLYSQVAAEAKVPVEKAMAACYLADLSRAGKSLDEAAALLRCDRAEARDIARAWSIPFSDYDRSKRARLAWRKERRGKWLLEHDGRAFGEAVADGHGGYVARAADMLADGSSAEVAARRLSRAIERRSNELVGVDDVVIEMPGPDGATTQLAPKSDGDTSKLAKALAL